MTRVVSLNKSSISALRDTVTDSRGHPAKASLSIIVTEFGMVTDTNEEQSMKTLYPIIVTEFGMVTDVNEEQSAKAVFPISVTELGIEIDVNDEQYAKA